MAWLVRPIRACKPLPEVGHQWERACWPIGQLEPSSSTFVFGCVGTFILWVDGTFMNQVSPSWSVGWCGFPRCDVDVEVLQVGYESLCSAYAGFLLSCYHEFTVQQRFGYPEVWHTTKSNVSCPSWLSFAHDGNDAGEVSQECRCRGSRFASDRTAKHVTRL